jgi:hypothetical protein
MAQNIVVGKLKEKIKLVTRSGSMDNPDGGLRLEEEVSHLSQVNRNNNCKEMSPRDDCKDRRKDGNFDTTAERERMEPPRSMKDNTK